MISQERNSAQYTWPHFWRLTAAACIFAGVTSLALSHANAVELTVESTPIETFAGKPIGARVDGLIWRGGMVLTSASPEFGGLSSIGVASPEGHMVMVSDVGNFVSGQLIHDDLGRPFQFVGVTLDPINNSKGNELPRAFAKDAEALDVIYRDGQPAAVRVGFENLTRVADFELDNYRPGGAAREIEIPQWLSDARTNKSLESVCIAPAASPIAGSTLLLTEEVMDKSGHVRAHLLGKNDKGDLAMVKPSGLNPTDCAFLPNGDLLVLERGTGLLSFVMQIRQISADQVHAGAVMDGPVILSASGGDIDNMEGLAVYYGPDGDQRIGILSDDNFNSWERTLYLEFSLP